MVTKVTTDQVCKSPGGKSYYRSIYYCMTYDVKPTDARNADTLYEMDKTNGVSRTFLFDEDSKTWILQ